MLIEIHGGPESSVLPRLPGPAQLPGQRAGARADHAERPRLLGLRQDVPEARQRHAPRGAVKDIGALFDWIARQNDLDKDRVGVIGGSYGGFMSLAVQTTYNDRIKAGIDIVGISNFVSFLKNTQGYRRDLSRGRVRRRARPGRCATFLERISPLASAGKIRTPILIVQGQNDPRVPLSEAEQVVSAVRKNGVPVWYVVGKNEGHGFARKINQDYLQAVEVLFLRRFLLGDENQSGSPVQF